MVTDASDHHARADVLTWRKHILVVANVTATSDELLAALEARAQAGPAAFTLIVPAPPFGIGRAAAGQRLGAAIERLRAAGLEVDGRLAHGDPVEAVRDAWDPRRYDEIIVSTLPMRTSKWLGAALPQRIAALTGALVTHVVSQPPREPIKIVHTQARDEHIGGPLAPLHALEAIARIEERPARSGRVTRSPDPPANRR